MSLSAAEARAVAIAAQGLPTPTSSLAEVFARLRTVQLDTIAVVRRSHELVALARGLSAEAAAALGTENSPVDTFEYWAHAVSLAPLDLWPAFGMRRRRVLAGGWTGPSVDPAAVNEVRERLRAEGPLTLTELGGARGNGWDRTSRERWAAEWLQQAGEAVVRHRRGWRRVYALASQSVPSHLLNAELDDDECVRVLAQAALDALGVGTTNDVADYFRLPASRVAAALHELGVARAPVEGWQQPAWLRPGGLPESPVSERPIPLSPFDSLVWFRPRQQRLFGRGWVLEAYKPAAKRSFGYFAMPVLHRGQLAGRVATRRARDGVLDVEAVEWNDDTDALHEVVETIRGWAGATSVRWPRPTHPVTG